MNFGAAKSLYRITAGIALSQNKYELAVKLFNRTITLINWLWKRQVTQKHPWQKSSDLKLGLLLG